MIVCRSEIMRKFMSGIRITGISSFANQQFLAIAKYIISEQIGKPVSEMTAMVMPNGNVAVRPRPLRKK